MKEAGNGAAFCPLCRHQGPCNFTEEWGLTYFSNACYLADVVDFNGDALFNLDQVIKKNGNSHNQSIQLPSNPETPTKQFLKPILIPQNQLLNGSNLPEFPIHAEGILTMKQELLDILLGIQGAHILRYLEEKEKEIPGANSLKADNHSGFFPPARPPRTITYAQLLEVLGRERRAYSSSLDLE